MIELSVFTPTYNRGYTLHKLKDSLLRQDSYDFEWIIVDDGSTDDTEEIVSNWRKEKLPFSINYKKVKNGGKPRAINKGVDMCKSDWMFWIDSDDYLADNIIGFIIQSLNEIKNDKSFVGIGGLRAFPNLEPFAKTSFTNSVDATHLERSKYGLNVDCNEVYRTSVLKQHPFKVWETEIFVPEEIVLNEIAMQGYKYRWYNKIFVISEYLDDGMTKGANNLIRRNPMGYAMLYNQKIIIESSIYRKFYNTCQFIAYCLIGKNPLYIAKCNNKLFSIACLPLGALLALRRYNQLYK